MLVLSIKERNHIAFQLTEGIKCNLGLILSTHVIIITWITSHASRAGLQQGLKDQTHFPWHKTLNSCLLLLPSDTIIKNKIKIRVVGDKCFFL